MIARHGAFALVISGLLLAACSSSGDTGTADGGDGSATGGDAGSGTGGSATGGSSGSATGGAAGSANGGSSGTDTGGNGGSATGGDGGATGGNGGATGGNGSATGGDGGATGGNGGATGGNGGATGGNGGATGGNGGATGGNGGATGGNGGATGGNGGAGGEPTQLVGILAAHNAVRAAHGVGPLVWDESLEAIATAWAATCTDNTSPIGLVDHNSGRSASYGSSVGENIYGSSGSTTGPAAVTSWASEESSYDYASNACSGVCGHYTQIVWAASTKVGCGFALCNGLTYGYTIVCDYAPAGNNGNRPY